MKSYRIVRQVTSLGSAGFACTVMAIREDTAGKNEFGVRLCATSAEAERAGHLLEAEIRRSVIVRGGTVFDGGVLAQAH